MIATPVRLSLFFRDGIAKMPALGPEPSSEGEADMAVKPIPDGYHTATPYLIIDGAARAIDFYKKAFGATELFRMDGPDGRVGHAEIKIGNSPIMLGDECPEMGYRSPKALGGPGISLMLYVEDVDARFDQAVAAGASVVRPVKDQFYGDRAGTVADPFGHVWTIATHKEDLTMEEIRRRAAAFMKQSA
jgi:PhnB protein